MLPQMGLPGDAARTAPAISRWSTCCSRPALRCASTPPATSARRTATPASSTAQFCSYHSQVDVDGTDVTYVVQPWTAQWGQGVGCDDPTAPNITFPVNRDALAQDVGSRLVSPLSQAKIAAISRIPVWTAGMGTTAAIGENGTEINDNGCGPLAGALDDVTINGNSYCLQREFNNAGAIETDPDALPCTGTVLLGSHVRRAWARRAG